VSKLTKEINLEVATSQTQDVAALQTRERTLEDALPQQNIKATSTVKASGDCEQSCGNCSSCACGDNSCGSCFSCASCGCDCAENLK